MGLLGWPLEFVQHIANATCVPPSPAGPPGSCPHHLPYVEDGMVIHLSWTGHLYSRDLKTQQFISWPVFMK